jgi:hypothetical protein
MTISLGSCESEANASSDYRVQSHSQGGMRRGDLPATIPQEASRGVDDGLCQLSPHIVRTVKSNASLWNRRLGRAEASWVESVDDVRIEGWRVIGAH